MIRGYSADLNCIPKDTVAGRIVAWWNVWWLVQSLLLEMQFRESKATGLRGGMSLRTGFHTTFRRAGSLEQWMNFTQFKGFVQHSGQLRASKLLSVELDFTIKLHLYVIILCNM